MSDIESNIINYFNIVSIFMNKILMYRLLPPKRHVLCKNFCNCFHQNYKSVSYNQCVSYTKTEVTGFFLKASSSKKKHHTSLQYLQQSGNIIFSTFFRSFWDLAILNNSTKVVMWRKSSSVFDNVQFFFRLFVGFGNLLMKKVTLSEICVLLLLTYNIFSIYCCNTL